MKQTEWLGALPAWRLERILSKVYVGADEDCWHWMGAHNGDGYGRINTGKRYVYAHRLMWEWENRASPGALFVLHHCDNPACCNPAHLFLGTNGDNMLDMSRKGRRDWSKGEAVKNSKLTAAQVGEIKRRLFSGGHTQKQIAADYGVGERCISAIKNGQTWRHIDG